jgi:hypothetical protein
LEPVIKVACRPPSLDASNARNFSAMSSVMAKLTGNHCHRKTAEPNKTIARASNLPDTGMFSLGWCNGMMAF